MSVSRCLAAALACLGFALAGCAGPVAPDLVITHARVFTNDPARPWAEAVAMKGERVVAVGTTTEALAAKGPSTRVVDAGGRVVVPGFNDAHVHVEVAPETVTLTLGQDPSLDALADAIATADRTAAPGVLLRGSIGPAAWEDPRLTRAWLDARAPSRSVWLQMWTGHGDVLSSAALTLVGLDDAVKDPVGGRHGRDAAGRLDGRLEEYAAYIASRRLAEGTPPARAVAIYKAFAGEAVRLGITSVQLMSTGLPARASVPRLLEAATPIRWRIFRLPTTAAGAETEDGRPHLPPQPGPRLDVRGTKWILDGTPIERLAALSAPYADRPAERGRMNLDTTGLETVVREGYGTENQLVVHAVGDAAIEAYLAALERVGAAAVWQRKRPRLEHGDMITASQMARARALGRRGRAEPGALPRSRHVRGAPRRPPRRVPAPGLDARRRRPARARIRWAAQPVSEHRLRDVASSASGRSAHARTSGGRLHAWRRLRRVHRTREGLARAGHAGRPCRAVRRPLHRAR